MVQWVRLAQRVRSVRMGLRLPKGRSGQLALSIQRVLMVPSVLKDPLGRWAR